jgi:hypothetical protein
MSAFKLVFTVVLVMLNGAVPTATEDVIRPEKLPYLEHTVFHLKVVLPKLCVSVTLGLRVAT